ncbi:MAG: sigma D regulator [Oleiphilaceae bacterium]|nr:sigma D regulator [Oleiphilaceae bacterium]
MLENYNSAKERWGGVSALIDGWLKERQQLIVRYCDLTGADADLDTPEVRARFNHLCEVLLDYVSAGHFEVYEQLIREAKEFDDGGLELVARVYPRIEQTTEVALAFNDQLEGLDVEESELSGLFQSLSKLGESLETRFEMEDFLIEHLHNAHADDLTSSA